MTERRVTWDVQLQARKPDGQLQSVQQLVELEAGQDARAEAAAALERLGWVDVEPIAAVVYPRSQRERPRRALTDD